MKLGLINQKIKEFLSVEYSPEYTQQQVNEAEISVLQVIEVKYNNGHIDSLIEDENGNLKLYSQNPIYED